MTAWPGGARSASRILLLLILVLWCLGAAQAQVPQASPEPRGPIASPTRVDSLAILYVKADGEWERSVQESWDALGTVPAGIRLQPWTGVLSARVAAVLAPEQRDQVLRFPQMLVDSSRRADLLGVRYVVLAFATRKGEPRLAPLVVDVATGSQQWIGVVKASERARMPVALGKALQEALARMGTRVWGHVAGKQFHVVGCDHVRKDQVITIDSVQEARQNGYEPCALCFPDLRDRARNGTEVALGREVAGYIERQYRLDPNPEHQARVERVGRAIVEGNGLRTFDYVFRVVESDAPNAFAAGAGHVYVTRGMERVTAGNDDMLATVMGHEIAHTEEHHVLRQYRQAQQWAILGALISIATRTNLGGLLADFAGGIISRGHSRRFEAEADRCGMLFAYGAGYRAQDFELVLNALKKLGGGKAPDWLRTHPTEERRLALMKQLMAQLEALDTSVRALSALDPAMGAYVRRRAAAFVAKRELVEGLVAPLRRALQGLAPAKVTTPARPPLPPQASPHEDVPSPGKTSSPEKPVPTPSAQPSGAPVPRTPGRPPEDD